MRSLDGDTVVASSRATTLPGEARRAPPTLPATLDRPPDATAPRRRGTSRCPATRGGGRYRVRAVDRPRRRRVLLVATSLPEVDCTLHRLLLIELVVTAVVLGALVALGLWLVRLGLRPLDAIGETAAAIAAGDLSRRVERAEERTEVGRLGLALNAMLGPDRDRRSGRRRRPSASSAASSPTPRTSCGRRSRPSAPTPSCTTRGAAERPDDLDALDEGDQPRVGADERPGRRPPPARAPRRGAPARARAGRARRGGRRGGRDRADGRSRPPDRARRSSRRSCSATATGCARSSTTCSRTSAPTRRPGRRVGVGRHAATASARDRGRRRRPGPRPRSTRSACSSASTAPTPRARARAAASASASRSSPPSPRRTGDGVRLVRARARARRSLSHCRSHPSRAPERPQPIHRQLTEPAQRQRLPWMETPFERTAMKRTVTQISAGAAALVIAAGTGAATYAALDGGGRPPSSAPRAPGRRRP